MSQQWQGPPGQQGYGPPQGANQQSYNQQYGQQNPGQPPYGQRPGSKSSNVLVTILIVLGILVVVVGILSALAISGVRRYLASAKSAEAKNTVSAIAREASVAYEREAAGTIGDSKAGAHHLCDSAQPVPAEVPHGTKYSPSAVTGKDYQTGDETHGWMCLRHSAQWPSYYQYDYRAGGDYKGPKRGGPDPGPDGFEVSAEGDLNGDGKTSLFTMTGKVDKKTGTVVMGKELFVSDEKE